MQVHVGDDFQLRRAAARPERPEAGGMQDNDTRGIGVRVELIIIDGFLDKSPATIDVPEQECAALVAPLGAHVQFIAHANP